MIVVEKGGFAVNNSNRTHDFVDLLAKISADRGLVFTTADAQKLKDTGYAIQGGTVNGVYDNGTVTLNINSPKALNSVVGHEVVHAMEGSDFYAPLRDIVVAYAEKTGEYDTRLKAIKELYAGKPGYETDLDSKAERELVADLIGDYVFSDPEFVRNLSVSNRNLFQKLYDEIKYLLKVATAGSKEARALEKVKKTFADVYRETKNTAQPDGVKYSVLDRRITAESTEQERYEILKDAELSVVEVKADAIQDVDLGAYNTRKKSAVASGFQELAKRLGILNVDLRNSKIAFPFKFSGANLSKSLHHQLEYGGTYQDYVKAMSCFNEIVESAIPIEVHTEKKTGTRKENPDLKQVYVLVSAYKDGKNIVPVELEVKEFRQRESSLYMTVVLTKIDLEVVDTGVPSNAGNVPHLFSRSIVSLQRLFSNVNPKDGRFLKYVPDGFLNEVQKNAKKEALSKQNKEYSSYSLFHESPLTTGENIYGQDVVLRNREETVPAAKRSKVDYSKVAPTKEDIALMEQEKAAQSEDGMQTLIRALDEIRAQSTRQTPEPETRAKAEKIVGDRNAVIRDRDVTNEAEPTATEGVSQKRLSCHIQRPRFYKYYRGI